MILDLRYIRSKCWEARTKWMDIGLELNLTKSDLDTLRDTYRENVEKCFTEMLAIWLRTNSRPTFVDLLAALKQKTIGFHQLAEEIEKEFKTERGKALTHVSTSQTSNIKCTIPPCTRENKIKNQYDFNSIKLGVHIFIIAVFLTGVHRTNVYNISPEDCFAIGKGVEMAEIGERANAVLYLVDKKGDDYTTKVGSVRCEIAHELSGEQLDCSARKTSRNQYKIRYKPTRRGRHKLHIKVEGEYIKGSPFNVTVIKKLGTSVRVVTGLKEPWGVAVTKRGNVLVAERLGHCISILNQETGKRLRSLGSQGSGQGQFSHPCGVAVSFWYLNDFEGDIAVTDGGHRVQTFVSEHYIPFRSIGSHGTNHLQFDHPLGVAASSTTWKIAVADCYNHRVQILNQDLTFHSSIGSKGIGNGQLDSPFDVAFDSAGNLYVTDTLNHCIQVFNQEGKFLREFGSVGKGDGELDYPTGVCIDTFSDDTVYVVEGNNHRVSVFTNKGKFLTSFGSSGTGAGQFKSPRGITVDRNGTIYVADSGNNRLQIF